MRIPRRFDEAELRANPGPAWAPVPGGDEPGRVWNAPGAFALLKCAHGHVATLTAPTHRADAAGKVTPSCVCPYAGCNFHEWAELEGWQPHDPTPTQTQTPTTPT